MNVRRRLDPRADVRKARSADEKVLGKYYDKNDAFVDVRPIDKCIWPRPWECWVSDEADNRIL